MLRGKTRRNTPIRSTIGMRSGPNHQGWILVADRHRLCLYERTRDQAEQGMALRQEFINPQGRMKGHDMVSDRPGRSFDSRVLSQHGQSGGARHAYGGGGEPEDRAVDLLLKKAVELLEDSTIKKDKSTLTVLAEPKLLGLLRPALEKAAPKMEMSFAEKDYAWLKSAKLKQRLNSLFVG